MSNDTYDTVAENYYSNFTTVKWLQHFNSHEADRYLIGLVYIPGKALQSESIKNRADSDIMMGTSLVSMYARCRDIYGSRKVFDEMPEINVVTYSRLGFVVNRRLDEWVKLEQLDLDSVEVVVDEKDTNGMLQIADNDLLDDPVIIGAIDEETEFNALVEEEAALLE